MARFFASNESHRDVSWNVVILVVQNKFSYSSCDPRGQGIAQRESFSRSLIVILHSMGRRARPSSTHPGDWTRQLYTMDSPRINIKWRLAGGFALQHATLERPCNTREALQHATLERPCGARLCWYHVTICVSALNQPHGKQQTAQLPDRTAFSQDSRTS
jgi:hypothetical protein